MSPFDLAILPVAAPGSIGAERTSTKSVSPEDRATSFEALLSADTSENEGDVVEAATAARPTAPTGLALKQGGPEDNTAEEAATPSEASTGSDAALPASPMIVGASVQTAVESFGSLPAAFVPTIAIDATAAEDTSVAQGDDPAAPVQLTTTDPATSEPVSAGDDLARDARPVATATGVPLPASDADLGVSQAEPSIRTADRPDISDPAAVRGADAPAPSGTQGREARPSARSEATPGQEKTQTVSGQASRPVDKVPGVAAPQMVEDDVQSTPKADASGRLAPTNAAVVAAAVVSGPSRVTTRVDTKGIVPSAENDGESDIGTGKISTVPSATPEGGEAVSANERGLPADRVAKGADPAFADGRKPSPSTVEAPSTTLPSPTGGAQPASAERSAAAVPITLEAEPIAAPPSSGSPPVVEAPVPLSSAGTDPASAARVAPEPSAQIVAQIMRRTEGKATRFEIALTPDDLGRVDVSLSIDAEGRLAATLAFDNPVAATELRGRADELRRQLQEAGFQVADDALSFAERDGGSGRGGAFDEPSGRHDGRAFAAAARIADQADQATAAPWMSLTLTPDRVDMRV